MKAKTCFRNLISVVALAICAYGVSGCRATNLQETPNSKPPNQLEFVKDRGLLLIARRSGETSSCRYTITINRVVVGPIDPNSFYAISVPPGRYSFGATMLKSTLCDPASIGYLGLEMTVAAGDSRTIAVFTSSPWKFLVPDEYTATQPRLQFAIVPGAARGKFLRSSNMITYLSFDADTDTQCDANPCEGHLTSKEVPNLHIQAAPAKP